MSSWNLGVRLKHWRDLTRTPLKQVASSLGVSEGTVSRWERGARFPSREKLEGLSALLGVPVCAFFCEQEQDCGHFESPVKEG